MDKFVWDWQESGSGAVAAMWTWGWQVEMPGGGVKREIAQGSLTG